MRGETLYWNLGTQNIYAGAPQGGSYIAGFSGYFQGIIARAAVNYRF